MESIIRNWQPKKIVVERKYFFTKIPMRPKAGHPQPQFPPALANGCRSGALAANNTPVNKYTAAPLNPAGSARGGPATTPIPPCSGEWL